MTMHSSILAWRSPWTEESGGLQSTGLQRVGHNWAIKHAFLLSPLPTPPGCRRAPGWAPCALQQLLSSCFTHGRRHFYQRRHWRPTPALLPGKSHGWRSLVGCSPWGREESDLTEQLHFYFSLSRTGEGNGNPLQCSCLENPRDGGAWWAAICGVAQSRTRLTWLSSSSSSSSVSMSMLLSPLVPFPLPSLYPQVHLHIWASIPSLQMGSSVLLFYPYICVNIWYLFFSFWLSSLSITGSRFIHFIRTKESDFLEPNFILDCALCFEQ